MRVIVSIGKSASERVLRSWRRCRFSRRRPRNSLQPALLRTSTPRRASCCDCSTYEAIVAKQGPNSFASSSLLRATQGSPTIRSLKAAGYGFLGLGMRTPSLQSRLVATKPGEFQTRRDRLCFMPPAAWASLCLRLPPPTTAGLSRRSRASVVVCRPPQKDLPPAHPSAWPICGWRRSGHLTARSHR